MEGANRARYSRCREIPLHPTGLGHSFCQKRDLATCNLDMRYVKWGLGAIGARYYVLTIDSGGERCTKGRQQVITSSTFSPHYSARCTQQVLGQEHVSTVFDGVEMYISHQQHVRFTVCTLPTARVTWGCWVRSADIVYQPQLV